MRLVIVTPLAVAVDEARVTALTAEDASGRFGILPRHADFLTVLEISVLSWTNASGRHHCAVRSGVLTVLGGDTVSVTTHEAVMDDDLDRLSDTVLDRFRREEDEERAEQTDATRLHLAAIRQIVQSLGTRSRKDLS